MTSYEELSEVSNNARRLRELIKHIQTESYDLAFALSFSKCLKCNGFFLEPNNATTGKVDNPSAYSISFCGGCPGRCANSGAQTQTSWNIVERFLERYQYYLFTEETPTLHLDETSILNLIAYCDKFIDAENIPFSDPALPALCNDGTPPKVSDKVYTAPDFSIYKKKVLWKYIVFLKYTNTITRHDRYWQFAPPLASKKKVYMELVATTAINVWRWKNFSLENQISAHVPHLTSTQNVLDLFDTQKWEPNFWFDYSALLDEPAEFCKILAEKHNKILSEADLYRQIDGGHYADYASSPSASANEFSVRAGAIISTTVLKMQIACLRESVAVYPKSGIFLIFAAFVVERRCPGVLSPNEVEDMERTLRCNDGQNQNIFEIAVRRVSEFALPKEHEKLKVTNAIRTSCRDETVRVVECMFSFKDTMIMYAIEMDRKRAAFNMAAGRLDEIDREEWYKICTSNSISSGSDPEEHAKLENSATMSKSDSTLHKMFIRAKLMECLISSDFLSQQVDIFSTFTTEIDPGVTNGEFDNYSSKSTGTDLCYRMVADLVWVNCIWGYLYTNLRMRAAEPKDASIVQVELLKELNDLKWEEICKNSEWLRLYIAAAHYDIDRCLGDLPSKEILFEQFCSPLPNENIYAHRIRISSILYTLVARVQQGFLGMESGTDSVDDADKRFREQSLAPGVFCLLRCNVEVRNYLLQIANAVKLMPVHGFEIKKVGWAKHIRAISKRTDLATEDAGEIDRKCKKIYRDAKGAFNAAVRLVMPFESIKYAYCMADKFATTVEQTRVTNALTVVKTGEFIVSAKVSCDFIETTCTDKTTGEIVDALASAIVRNKNPIIGNATTPLPLVRAPLSVFERLWASDFGLFVNFLFARRYEASDLESVSTITATFEKIAEAEAKMKQTVNAMAAYINVYNPKQIEDTALAAVVSDLSQVMQTDDRYILDKQTAGAKDVKWVHKLIANHFNYHISKLSLKEKQRRACIFALSWLFLDSIRKIFVNITASSEPIAST